MGLLDFVVNVREQLTWTTVLVLIMTTVGVWWYNERQRWKEQVRTLARPTRDKLEAVARNDPGVTKLE